MVIFLFDYFSLWFGICLIITLLYPIQTSLILYTKRKKGKPIFFYSFRISISWSAEIVWKSKNFFHHFFRPKKEQVGGNLF